MFETDSDGESNTYDPTSTLAANHEIIRICSLR